MEVKTEEGYYTVQVNGMTVEVIPVLRIPRMTFEGTRGDVTGFRCEPLCRKSRLLARFAKDHWRDEAKAIVHEFTCY